MKPTPFHTHVTVDHCDARQVRKNFVQCTAPRSSATAMMCAS